MRRITTAREQVQMLSPWQAVEVAHRRVVAEHDDIVHHDENSDDLSSSVENIGNERRVTVYRKHEVVGRLSWYADTGQVVTIHPSEGHIADFLKDVAREVEPNLDFDAKHDHPLDDASYYGHTHEARRKLAAKELYPSQWPGDPNNPNQRGRHRPPTVPIRFEKMGNSVHAYHADTDEHLGTYDWSDRHHGPTIGTAALSTAGMGKGVGGAILDHIRDNYAPDLKHSATLSYQGRAATLRDPGTTKAEWDKTFALRPFNHGDRYPYGAYGEHSPEQQKRHDDLKQKWEEEHRAGLHDTIIDDDPHSPGEPWYGSGSRHSFDDYNDNYEEPPEPEHEWGYDNYGDYVGDPEDHEGSGHDLYGNKHPHGWDEDGNYVGPHGGYDESGHDPGGVDHYGYQRNDMERPRGYQSVTEVGNHYAEHGIDPQTEGAHPDTAHILSEEGQWTNQPVYRVADHDSLHRIGNGDTVHTSLESARRAAQHPTDPEHDKQILKATVDPGALMRHPSVPNINRWIYDSHAGEPASVEAHPHEDPEMNQRILNRLGPGWSPVDHQTYERTQAGVTSQLQRNGDLWGGTVSSLNRTRHHAPTLDGTLSKIDKAEADHRIAASMGDGQWEATGEGNFMNRDQQRFLRVTQSEDGTWEGRHARSAYSADSNPIAKQEGFSTPHEAADWAHNSHAEHQRQNDHTKWEGNWEQTDPHSNHFVRTDHPNGIGHVQTRVNGMSRGWVEHPTESGEHLPSPGQNFQSPHAAHLWTNRMLQFDPFNVSGTHAQ